MSSSIDDAAPLTPSAPVGESAGVRGERVRRPDDAPATRHPHPDPLPHAGDGEAQEEGNALFRDDTGALPLDTRRVIVQLLLGPALDVRRHARLWPVLLRDEAFVRSRLHELFLDLVIDRDQEVAFTRQVASSELELPVLLRRTPLTLLDSALLLLLRQRLTESDAQLERAVVSTGEMAEHLSMFERDSSTDHARFARQVQHAIDNAVKWSLLRKLRNTDDRFEVSPTLKLLFSAEEIQALAQSYRDKAAAIAAVSTLAADERERAGNADAADDAAPDLAMPSDEDTA